MYVGEQELIFWINIICRYLTYVYDSKYFLGTFLNDGNYKK